LHDVVAHAENHFEFVNRQFTEVSVEERCSSERADLAVESEPIEYQEEHPLAYAGIEHRLPSIPE
jgi:hypothetical protein